jgi:hypothetical protein
MSTAQVDHAKLSADAQARADALVQDDTLAQSKGTTPEHIEARKRVAKLFCDIHLAKENAATRDAHLAAIDYTCPVVIINARTVESAAPKKAGFFAGFRRKPNHLLSTAFPPKKPDDPVYALEYFVPKT